MTNELIIKARDGDINALNKLINNHKDLAYSIAYKYLKNNEDAEDIVQNSFIIVLKSIMNFRNDSKFSTWLYKIVYHECIKELKHKNKIIEYVPEFIELPQEEKITENKFLNININDLLKCLKPQEYNIISLFYLKEKSINDIAIITSLSKSNVKVILHRARKKLKQENILA